MKKVVAFAVLILCITPMIAQASTIPPVAVLTSTPNQNWFYNAEIIYFSSGNSTDQDGYIVESKLYFNGTYVGGSSYTFNYPFCITLYGTAESGCYELASGATTVSVTLEVKDNHGNTDSVTQTYTIQEHKGRKYFVTDHLGSVRATVNRDGNVLGYSDYYPFGLEMPGRSNNTANPNDNYKFTGHERDDEAGLNLVHAGARMLDPIIGRWLSIDPLAAKYPSLSPYNYVANNPINAFDPDGRDIWFVHGTYSGTNTWNERGFNALGAWENVLGDRIHGRSNTNISASAGNFRWSGNNYPSARTDAARSLADQIATARSSNPEMLVQLVAHSHGGNVSIEAARILKEEYDITVDRLVLLGTPSRSDYEIMEGSVAEIINVYNENDLVQIMGGIDTPFGMGVKISGSAAKRKRSQSEGAIEIDVTTIGKNGAIEAHTTIHNTQDLIDYVNKILNEDND